VAQLEIRLFGSLSIVCDGQPITAVQGRKGRDLLSYLLLRHDVPHSREEVAALFWGDRDDRHARHCFNTALWRLQAALGGNRGAARRWLHVDAQTVSFCPDNAVFVDVIEFERRCGLADGLPAAEGDLQAALRRDATALYRGDLLADCYEDWCLADRERLERLYVRALRRLVEYHRQRGEFGLAIDDAQRILACDPLREEVHRDLIRLYIAAGQPAAALRQYRACVDVLKRDLGAVPMQDTSLLVQHLMHGPTCSIGELARPAEERESAPSAPSNPHSAGVNLMLDICRRLRDIAAALESAATCLAPASGHEPRQMQTAIAPQLEPVIAVVKREATCIQCAVSAAQGASGGAHQCVGGTL
jgi:DNA-binding SARP family transcriptional activator